jgi:hypothetical protein
MSDLDLFLELEAAAARARHELLQDPSAVLGLVSSGARPDYSAYWEIVRQLRQGVRAAAGMHWVLIQESQEWREVFGLARRWCNAQLALSRLALAGVARRCHLVDIVDVDRALITIQRF